MTSRSLRPPDAPPPPISKTAIGGLLMGVANLIPGLSGGTMILAMGLYTEFIDSVAEVTSLRFTRRRVVFLAVVTAFAAAAIVSLASVILYLLFHHTAAMYALFIGLTLGGAPLLAKSLRPIRFDVVVAVALGIGLMVGVSRLRAGGGMPHHATMDVVAGVVGATTMVLPGISGSYMLLVMDQYDRVIGTVADLKAGIRQRDAAIVTRAAKIALPVGLGVLVGVIALSNLLKYLLHRHERATVGFLLGMLLGSVAGLWPFGRVPSQDAMERRSVAELRTFADRGGIAVVDDSDKETIIASIIEAGRRGALADHRPATIGVVALMVVGGSLITKTLAARGEALGAKAHDRPGRADAPLGP